MDHDIIRWWNIRWFTTWSNSFVLKPCEEKKKLHRFSLCVCVCVRTQSLHACGLNKQTDISSVKVIYSTTLLINTECVTMAMSLSTSLDEWSQYPLYSFSLSLSLFYSVCTTMFSNKLNACSLHDGWQLSTFNVLRDSVCSDFTVMWEGFQDWFIDWSQSHKPDLLISYSCWD